MLAMAAVSLGLLAAGPAYAASSEYCGAYATDYANRVTPGEDVIGGAIGGAVIGAIIGGATRGSSGVGPGAAIGGGAGAVAGAASHSAKWQRAYEHAYKDCMGSGVSYGGSPEPWTEEWYAYCSAKYRSFDPADGTFQPYNGPRRRCR